MVRILKLEKREDSVKRTVGGVQDPLSGTVGGPRMMPQEENVQLAYISDPEQGDISHTDVSSDILPF